MPLQRRYSVTGQTPPDNVGAMKSPKLQALDTSVQTSCGLCEAGGDAAVPCTASTASEMGMEVNVEAGAEEPERGRKAAHHAIIRTSSKRSATQLPSPSSPSPELPIKKLNCMGLGHDDMKMDMDMDMDMDEGSLSDPFPEESDWALSSFDGSSSASFPSSPDFSPLTCSLPDDGIDEAICLQEPALPISYLDHDCISDSLVLSPPSSNASLPPTLLTLPPELRHQIYRHLPDLVLSHPLIYCLSTFANNMQHPLASVSRLIRAEALAIFYSYNTWIIKLEFKIMYDAFQDWIIRLGDGAGSLRVVTVAVRGSLFKPRTSHTSNLATNGQLTNGVPTPGAPRIDVYHPPDGDASFRIDLSEKWVGGRVEVERNDGTKEAGEKAKAFLGKMVEGLWEKRRAGTLNGQDWVNMVEAFLSFTGWW
ncbi:hypothetical protein K505DRAFT_323338 [Melanomma pulvis-pyrius CBS 109.77]|uniref:F-box domain-containing protein n=1 Tax=Melanomma pulvis-pyrius CBS 109.77 TaxID=1314802 RepID=A0A6A6XIQ1_9PLEO|nr:hypothetical protein K505DRAFT_323338 [Melanomma pulvis-pyrius CBS 109.77]